uniref:SMP-30/Gluconolactonase/LRE-like region domain-containing protein n=1 Tax=Bigelowiella natans TaxID=227086 RepID=A0A6T9YGE3_BIGNA|mmetsp:Transcript_1668/g.2508  ORF Transcript_1668/g.2508 Transcript_1668/m.2508 type:complete len:102 (+) Transcript_1668:168-473(+)
MNYFQALFFSPVGLAFDSRDNLFVVEQYGNRVRRINPTGEVTTIAGKPFSVNTQKWSVDGVPFEFFLPDAPDDDPQDPEDPGWRTFPLPSSHKYLASFSNE